MGFRFQRRFKILPGVTLNVSKSGVSTSLGTQGAHVTLSKDGIRETVGLPGTGVSYTDRQSVSPAWKTHWRGIVYVLIVLMSAAALLVYFARAR